MADDGRVGSQQDREGQEALDRQINAAVAPVEVGAAELCQADGIHILLLLCGHREDGDGGGGGGKGWLGGASAFGAIATSTTPVTPAAIAINSIVEAGIVKSAIVAAATIVAVVLLCGES